MVIQDGFRISGRGRESGIILLLRRPGRRRHDDGHVGAIVRNRLIVKPLTHMGDIHLHAGLAGLAQRQRLDQLFEGLVPAAELPGVVDGEFHPAGLRFLVGVPRFPGRSLGHDVRQRFRIRPQSAETAAFESGHNAGNIVGERLQRDHFPMLLSLHPATKADDTGKRGRLNIFSLPLGVGRPGQFPDIIENVLVRLVITVEHQIRQLVVRLVDGDLVRPECQQGQPRAETAASRRLGGRIAPREIRLPEFDIGEIIAREIRRSGVRMAE